MADMRPLKLVAPWYRWQRQLSDGTAQTPRTTRPVFQKFNRPDFLEGFLKEPQRSLKFTDVDRILQPNLIEPPLLSGGLFQKSASVYAPKLKGGTSPKKPEPYRNSMRKLFLDTHRRYYLVVCELHCDAPGFPNEPTQRICQAGFVVRRRYVSYPRSAQKEALALLKEIVAIEARIAELDQTAPVKPSVAHKRALKVRKMMREGTFASTRADLMQQLAAQRRALQAWKEENGAHVVREGWLPGPFDKVGRWGVVEDTPQALTEVTYPLYPLHTNPDIPGHDGRGKSLYFGVIPTSGLETTERGKARFDDQTLYEVRCFVRRHPPECPRRPQAPDCHGELFWSEPTEPYRLASQFDLEGTSNFPITIQMPNLEELAAQAIALPFGRFSSVKVVQPQTLNPSIKELALVGGSMGGQAICFFAVPLITIVAFFTLKLFLPIVVFLFGLWFLLVLRFCIPPSFQVNAALDMEINALPLDAPLDFTIQVEIDGELVTKTAAEVHGELADWMVEGITEGTGLGGAGADLNEVKEKLKDTSTYPQQVGLHSRFREEARLPTSVEEEADETFGPDLVAGVEYEERVTVEVPVS